MNPRLRMVLLKCRAANMPSDNIERAIKRGIGGEDTASYEDLTYEVFGPNGVAILVEISTDNRNRTAAEIRSLLTKLGGTIAASGSVSRLFERRGQIIVERGAVEEDRLMEIALEAGADDLLADSDGYEVVTSPPAFEKVHRQIEAQGIRCVVAHVTSVPALTVPLDQAGSAPVTKLMDALEDHDDVKEVYSNLELREGQA
jgi:YebC/PmpR family DNA-binding regulatory protein